MREVFLEYAKRGAMTKEELASVLKISPEAVRRMAKDGRIPRLPGIRYVRFDPLKMIEVFCETENSRSLTIKGSSYAKSPKRKGALRVCL